MDARLPQLHLGLQVLIKSSVPLVHGAHGAVPEILRKRESACEDIVGRGQSELAQEVRVGGVRSPRVAAELLLEPRDAEERLEDEPGEGDALLGEFGESFADRDDVYEVQFAPKALLALEGKFDRLGSMFVILALVLLSASLLMILFVIQVAVFARRREIELQQLVGATNSGASQVSGVEQSG